MSTENGNEAPGGQFRIGLDIGGTFTDLAVFDSERAEFSQFKSLTTPDPVDCVSTCLEKAAAHAGLSLEEYLPRVELVFCFGSTIGLNTLLTRTGATVGVITTKGHRDAYHIAQMDRGGVIDVREASEQTFEPLIPRKRILEVTERQDYAGTIVAPLDEDEVREAARVLVEEQEVDAIVISFLWAHRNADHEHRARDIVQAAYPDVFITCASDLSGSLGEFRRVATGVINAYIGQAVERQGERLRSYLSERGLKVPLLVMQTLGGVAPLEEVVKTPVNLLNSGPAGGVVAALAVANEIEEPNLVCMDIGGTSCDISAITDGALELSSSLKVLGHPIAISGVDIESIGAGGGSIATMERAAGISRLRVGPESAGSAPGPASYGRGGSKPTVTDANLILGLLDPDVRLGGEIALDVDKARRAISEFASATGDADQVVEDAWGIFRVITAQMSNAIETFLVSKGFDPRRYSLAAFGAASGIHAAAIGARLGSPRVVLPSFFPVFSAFGLMTTDIRHAYTLTDDAVKISATGEPAAGLAEKAEYVSERLRDVARLPLELLAREQVPEDSREVRLSIDMRYSGQILELNTLVPDGTLARGLDADSLSVLARGWMDKYTRVYGEGAAWTGGEIELINYRAVGVGRIASPAGTGNEIAGGNGDQASGDGRTRRIYLGEWMDAQVMSEDVLTRGRRIEGPTIIEGDLRTVLVGPSDVAEVDARGNVHLTPGETWER